MRELRFLLSCFAVFICGQLATWWLLGCSPAAVQVQATAATVVARSVNTLTPRLVAAERREGLDAIGSADTRDDAEAALELVRARWAPVWASHRVFMAAHGSYATSLESGHTAAPEALYQAYCDLRWQVWPWERLPDIPSAPCPEDSRY